VMYMRRISIPLFKSINESLISARASDDNSTTTGDDASVMVESGEGEACVVRRERDGVGRIRRRRGRVGVAELNEFDDHAAVVEALGAPPKVGLGGGSGGVMAWVSIAEWWL
jgi:hypothetical protein